MLFVLSVTGGAASCVVGGVAEDDAAGCAFDLLYLTGDSLSRNSRSLGSSLLMGSLELPPPNIDGSQPIVSVQAG